MNLSPPVLIVGAGPAGIGCALALQACGIPAEIMDASGVGASFEAWPAQMHLLTPSFHCNSFGYADLNALTPDTSPADFLHTQHPDGPAYARYLQALVRHFQIRVIAPARVTEITPLENGGFDVHAMGVTRRFSFVIWAAGEFAHPDTGGIRGADHCLHNSRVKDWNEAARLGKEFAVIGGYESGIDAAIHLMNAGCKVHLLSRGEPWGSDDPDPSVSLSPHTRDRLKAALLHAPGQVHFYKHADIVSVEKTAAGFVIRDRQGNPWTTTAPPVLCTGFRSALEPVRHLWRWQKGQPVFTEETDESPLYPGLFYSGPSLQHRGMPFCFIYKYRARFGIIARAIALRLGLPWEAELHRWKERGFMMEDLSCCTDCQCAVDAEETDNPEVLEYATLA